MSVFSIDCLFQGACRKCWINAILSRTRGSPCTCGPPVRLSLGLTVRAIPPRRDRTIGRGDISAAGWRVASLEPLTQPYRIRRRAIRASRSGGVSPKPRGNLLASKSSHDGRWARIMPPSRKNPRFPGNNPSSHQHHEDCYQGLAGTASTGEPSSAADPPAPRISHYSHLHADLVTPLTRRGPDPRWNPITQMALSDDRPTREPRTFLHRRAAAREIRYSGATRGYPAETGSSYGGSLGASSPSSFAGSFQA